MSATVSVEEIRFIRFARPVWRERIGPAEVEYLQLGTPNYRTRHARQNQTAGLERCVKALEDRLR
jgi:hypothetical protein